MNLIQQTKIMDDLILDFINYMPRVYDVNPVVFDPIFHTKLEAMNQQSLKNPDSRTRVIQKCFDLCSKELDKSDVVHRARQKPCGYAGDYLIIDWFYQQKAGSENGGHIWDYFSHRQAGIRAVRNRLAFFCEMIRFFAINKPDGFSVLDIASGPCRDVRKAIAQSAHLTSSIHFHCVDQDEHAIQYAQQLVGDDHENVFVQWEHANAFFIKPEQHYDFCWAAGLFDYLNDRLAAALLRKMWRWTKNNGTLIVGNYHVNHPTRNYLEWCGQWFLIHRTEEELLCIAERAGIPKECCTFFMESSGSCVFLIAEK